MFDDVFRLMLAMVAIRTEEHDEGVFVCVKVLGIEIGNTIRQQNFKIWNAQAFEMCRYGICGGRCRSCSADEGEQKEK